MMYPEIKLAQSIILLCKAKNIKHIVISPGSRNAPLTIGFVSDPFFTCYSIADERCAAFFGMGIAQQTSYPVALICTSGSALLNYYPAVSEAFYSQIPLVVISADRPVSKIDIGDGQTIRQRNVYHNHILFNANLEEDGSVDNDALLNEAINIAITQKGPVHINAPFEEPLYNTIEASTVKITVVEPKKQAHIPVDYSSFAKQWNKAKRKLILVGVNTPRDLEEDLVNQFANDSSVTVFLENTANLHHPTFITNIDGILAPFTEEDFLALQPDILITFGGMVVSKRVKSMLRTYKPTQHWHIDELRHYDTFFALTHPIKDKPQQFFKHILPLTNPVESTYHNWMQNILKDRLSKHDTYFAAMPYCDLKAMQILHQTMPKNSLLQISNSSVVRYGQLLPLDSSIDVFCNRGTSGIDGSTSTAIGAAIGSGKQTVILTGDVSFLYDSNALWNNYIPKDFKIVILNNQGGAIFRTLPGHQETPVFNTYFETSHQLTAEHLSKMYHLNYYQATDDASLSAVIQEFWATNTKGSILEIVTPTVTNTNVYKAYFKNL